MKLLSSLILLILATGLLLPSLQANPSRTLKVYLFAGQSNCNGAGGRVPSYPINSTDWRSPYTYNIGEHNFNENPNILPQDRTWSFRTSGQVISHALYPFNTILKPVNQRRKRANFDGNFIAAARLQGAETGDWWDPSIGNQGFNSFIGSEIQFARNMRSRIPESVAIIKVSAASSTMDNWEPAKHHWISSPNQYAARIGRSPLLLFKTMIPFVRQSLQNFAQVKNPNGSLKYDKVELAGFVWIQGESDLHRFRKELSPNRIRIEENDYKESFRTIVSTLRANFNRSMPFVICLSKGYSGTPEEVMNDEADFSHAAGTSLRSKKFQNIQRQLAYSDFIGGRIVDTLDATLIDNVHWDSPSLVRIGNRIEYQFRQMR